MKRDLLADLAARNDELAERIRQLEDILFGAVPFPGEWRLTQTEAVVFSALVRRRLVTDEQFMTFLYSDRVDDAPDVKIIDVMVCKIRRKLKPFDVTIHTLWGQGYYLDTKTRDTYRPGPRTRLAA